MDDTEAARREKTERRGDPCERQRELVEALQSSLAKARLIEQFLAARRTLIEGEPCPLCGGRIITLGS